MIFVSDVLRRIIRSDLFRVDSQYRKNPQKLFIIVVQPSDPVECFTIKRSVTAYMLEMRLKIFEGQFLSDLLIFPRPILMWGNCRIKEGYFFDDPLS